MMPSNVNNLIREGVNAFREGRRDVARSLLTQATQQDARNEEAWLWLSAMVDTLEEQQICLENVLAINPSNKRALQGLDAINRQIGRQPNSASPPPPPATPPSAAPQPPATEAPAPPPNPFTSQSDPFVQQGASFHGSGGNVALPSEDEYDDWVQGLNLGGSPEPSPASGDALTTGEFDLNSGPFQQQPEAPASDPFIQMEGGGGEPAPLGEMLSPGQEAPTPDAGGGLDELRAQTADDDFDLFAEGDAQPLADDDLFGDLDVPEEAFDLDDDMQQVGAAQLQQFFQYIPKNIRATRLPGQTGYPRPLLLGLAGAGAGTVLGLIVMIALLLG